MKPTIIQQLKDRIEYHQREIRDHGEAISILTPILDLPIDVNASGSIWIWVTNREDLKRVMILAPFWEKVSGVSESVDYIAKVGDRDIRIIAQEGALPPTCELVEVEEVVPAEPEKIVKRKIVKCSPPTTTNTN